MPGSKIRPGRTSFETLRLLTSHRDGIFPAVGSRWLAEKLGCAPGNVPKKIDVLRANLRQGVGIITVRERFQLRVNHDAVEARDMDPGNWEAMGGRLRCVKGWIRIDGDAPALVPQQCRRLLMRIARGDLPTADTLMADAGLLKAAFDSRLERLSIKFGPEFVTCSGSPERYGLDLSRRVRLPLPADLPTLEETLRLFDRPPRRGARGNKVVLVRWLYRASRPECTYRELCDRLDLESSHIRQLLLRGLGLVRGASVLVREHPDTKKVMIRLFTSADIAPESRRAQEQAPAVSQAAAAVSSPSAAEAGWMSFIDYEALRGTEGDMNDE